MSRPFDASFPSCDWPARRALWRIHRASRSPWWFSDAGTGRFDPVAAPGMGASYWAGEPLGAFVETFRTRMDIDAADLSDLRISRAAFGRALRLADVRDRRAARYGVTATVGAGGDYAGAQDLAGAAHAHGFDGVCWWVRHDPAQRLVGVALFGPAGAAASRRPRPRTERLSAQLCSDARAAFGYRVVPGP